MNADPTPHSHPLDRPEVLMHLFHPRGEYPGTYRGPAEDAMIPVAADTRVGARFHMGASGNPNLLFFHGNGEIVADYDDLGPLFNRRGLNLLAVDYRGYGRSNGQPTVYDLLADSHAVFDYTRDWLAANDYGGPLILMGRSLGSAPALELAQAYPSDIDGLIVESGFARAVPLLRRLGIDTDRLGFQEPHGFGHLEKIGRYPGPTLIIHAELDHIIPCSDGQALWDASPAAHKRLLMIPGANHNDIFLRGMEAYLEALVELGRLCAAPSGGELPS
jgi:fermentation-respiration switch protein FrsA (DUF1100 family)